jgi:hypothetical protein
VEDPRSNQNQLTESYVEAHIAPPFRFLQDLLSPDKSGIRTSYVLELYFSCLRLDRDLAPDRLVPNKFLDHSVVFCPPFSIIKIGSL